MTMRGSTGSFWGDLIAYAIAGLVLYVIAFAVQFIWRIIKEQMKK